MKQFVHGVDALGSQHFGQPGADTFNVLNGGSQFQHLKGW
jgi:hypothetical protein